MLKIFDIVVTTRNPSGAPGDHGQCEEGFYTVAHDLLTLVDAGGRPLRSKGGDRITQRLLAGDNTRQIASRLVLAHWRDQRPAGEVPGFNESVRYSDRYGGY